MHLWSPLVHKNLHIWGFYIILGINTLYTVFYLVPMAWKGLMFKTPVIIEIKLIVCMLCDYRYR